MDVTCLKFRFLLFFSLLLSVSVTAQDLRFIYIQTDNKQPFYVKLDKNYLSSSASGYIIIAKLTTGTTYQLNIGFPNSQLPELQAALQVKGVNAGYLLQKSGDRDWGLVNLQTMEQVALKKQATVNIEMVIVAAGDEFSRVLAEVVNDPSLNQVLVVKKDTDPTSISTVTRKEDAAAIKKEEGAALKKTEKIAKNEIVMPASATKDYVIAKLSQDSSSGGLVMAYADKSDVGNDTIKVFIPATPVKQTGQVKKVETTKSDTRVIDMVLKNPNNQEDVVAVRKEELVINEKKKLPEPVIEIKIDRGAAAKAITNTTCKQMATQSDFLKLRRQMAAEENEKGMTKTAGKQFAMICFASEQIRNLGLLYITEDERYKFYVTAFPYVADRHNFAALEDQLSDIYYKTRFKAMFSR